MRRQISVMVRGLLAVATAILVCWHLPQTQAQMFVVSSNGFAGDGSVGEYQLNGTPINASLITGLHLPQGIAVSGADLFIADQTGTVSEYTTSGTLVNPTPYLGPLYQWGHCRVWIEPVHRGQPQ